MKVVVVKVNELKYVDGNRTINQKHVERLARAINNNNLLSMRPILVNRKKEILDGQHRVEACKLLNIHSVPAIIVEFSGDIGDIQEINKNNRTWSFTDYAKSYASQGNLEYASYISYQETTGFTSCVCLDVLTGNVNSRGGYGIRDLFINGRFVVKDIDRAERFYAHVSELFPFFTERICKKAFFVSALWRMYLHPKYNSKRLLKKLANGKLPVIKNTPSEMLQELEAVYNYHETDRVSFSQPNKE